MSRETLAHLNTNTLIGYTDKRGTAWHYRAEWQGDEPNHYPGPIPVEDVHRRLFYWTPLEGQPSVTVTMPNGDVLTFPDPDRKGIVRPDTGAIFDYFKLGYRMHLYPQWLVTNIEHVLDTGDLAIGSAGLLRGGAQAWVQIEMEDTISTCGVDFRTHLMGVTSLDGSLATNYVHGNQVVRCDNSMYGALGDKAASFFKVKHSRNSLGRLEDVRQALGIIHGQADAFAEQIERLTDQVVTDAQWAEFVAAYTEPGTESQRSRTIAENKQRALWQLWQSDERVTPWKNTAWGVLSATNTYGHHIKTVQSVSRAERNMSNAVLGVTRNEDARTLDLLAGILS